MERVLDAENQFVSIIKKTGNNETKDDIINKLSDNLALAKEELMITKSENAKLALNLDETNKKLELFADKMKNFETRMAQKPVTQQVTARK